MSSVVGTGSRFTLTLPRAACRASVAALPRTGAARRRPTRPLRAAADAGRAPARVPIVLLVEDNEDNLFTLRQVLAPLPVEMVTATSGRQAIASCRRALPDLVIMDMQMPGMSGLQATGAIRALPRRRATIPIVALTAQAMKGDRERILAAGCDEYLSKPVQPKALIADRESRCLVDADGTESNGARRARDSRDERSMARILLVDDGRAAGARPRPPLGCASERGDRCVSTVRWRAGAGCAPAGGGADATSCSRPPRSRRRWRGAAPSGDVLRETFDVFDEGVCLVGPGRRARGGQRHRARACTAAACAPSSRRPPARRSARGATADRGLSLEGRAYAVRAYPLSGRGAVLYVRDTTEEREREVRRLQAEKLASIGMLAAGVAHEINNPAAFVLANIEALAGHMRLLEEKLRELPEPAWRAPGPARRAVRGDAPSCRSRRRGWRASTASCATSARSRTPTTTRTAPIDVNAAVESALTHAAQRAQVPRAASSATCGATRPVRGERGRASGRCS